MAADPVRAIALLNEYFDIVGDAYALYLDAGSAMTRFVTFIEDHQKQSLARFKGQKDAPQSLEELDRLNFYYGKGDPNDPSAQVQHVSTQAEIKERNRDNGKNAKTVSRVVILTIYQFWEDHYREEFAKALKRQKNEIMSDFSETSGTFATTSSIIAT